MDYGLAGLTGRIVSGTQGCALVVIHKFRSGEHEVPASTPQALYSKAQGRRVAAHPGKIERITFGYAESVILARQSVLNPVGVLTHARPSTQGAPLANSGRPWALE